MYKLLTKYFDCKRLYEANNRDTDAYCKMVSAARKVIAHDRKHPMAICLIPNDECHDSERALQECRLLDATDIACEFLLDIGEGPIELNQAFSTTRFLGE